MTDEELTRAERIIGACEGGILNVDLMNTPLEDLVDTAKVLLAEVKRLRDARTASWERMRVLGGTETWEARNVLDEEFGAEPSDTPPTQNIRS